MERARVLSYFSYSLLHLLPIFLYAETHYRFRYFFSFLSKREPEIIADAPHRLEPNSPLPILILVKDAHKFPLLLEGIKVVIRSNGISVLEQNILESSIKINIKLWSRVFEIPLQGLTGNIECDVVFETSDGLQKRFYHNDNHRTSSHRPLRIFASSSSLPKFADLYFGECHSHSSYTDDQVEFGAPLEASTLLCRMFGLSFFCATDHSYDLDDMLDNYLVNDPQLSKWRLFQKEVDVCNQKLNNFVIIRGEEVTCRNSFNQNIHLLLLGTRKFFWGSGDGAEHWFKTKSEHTINEIMNTIEPSTLTFAAHPKEPVYLLQRILLHRGKWSENDFTHPRLSGIQFLNGQLTSGFSEGYCEWKKALLQGKRLFVLAGNDAHGNFNRFRQIGIPFLKIRETEHQLFGKMRTGAFVKVLSEENLLQAIGSGRTIATDGPVANLIVQTSGQKLSSLGQSFYGIKHTVMFEVRSSYEFGSIDSIQVLIGRIGQGESLLISEKHNHGFSYIRNLNFEVGEESYLRAEIWTSSVDSYDGRPHFCLTNPVWFKPA